MDPLLVTEPARRFRPPLRPQLLLQHGGTPPIAPSGATILIDAARLMIVLYCPKAAISPAGNSMPLASLPNGTPLILGPEITNPLCDFIFIFGIFSLTYVTISGARNTEFTGHCVWSHDAHVVMNEVSHLRLITMSLLQTCSYVTEQMRTEVKIDVNKFLEAFSIDIAGNNIHPPSWTLNENDSFDVIPSTSTPSTSMTNGDAVTPNPFGMHEYCKCRQAEALRWIDLQEKRSSIIARLQPVTPEEYEQFRDTVKSDAGPFRRKNKKQGSKGQHLY